MPEHGRGLLVATTLVCTYLLLTTNNFENEDATRTQDTGADRVKLESHPSVVDTRQAGGGGRVPAAAAAAKTAPTEAAELVARAGSSRQPTSESTVQDQPPPQVQSNNDNLSAKWSGEDLNGRYRGVREDSGQQEHALLPNISHNFDTAADTSFVIATGASSDHACWLVNMLASLHKRRPEWQVVVYDLGLKGDLNYTHLNMVHPKGIQLRRFQYANYPDYFRIDQAAGEYAWKPVIIKEMADEFGTVLWLDSGDSVGKKDNLTFVKDQLDSVGFYSPHSVGTLGEWTHPSSLEHFGIQPDAAGLAPYEGKSNCNGAFVGFNRDSPAYQKVLVPWAQCALDRNCIAPIGSDRSNHRQDQAILTVLAHQNGYVCYPKCKKACQGVQLHIDGMGWAKNVCNLMGINDGSNTKKKNKKKQMVEEKQEKKRK